MARKLKSSKKKAAPPPLAYETSATFVGHYKITADALGRLAQAAKQFIGDKTVSEVKRRKEGGSEWVETLVPAPIDWTIQFTGGHSISSTDIQSLLNDLLVRSKEIAKISAYALNVQTEPVSSVSITVNGAFTPISFQIKGDTVRSQTLRTQFEAIVSDMEQPWSLFAFSDNFAWQMLRVTIGFLCAFLAILLVYVSTGMPTFQGNIMYPVALVSAVVVVSASKARKILYPKVLFDIGRAGETTQWIEKTRSKVFWTIGVGLFVSIVSAVLLKIFLG